MEKFLEQLAEILEIKEPLNADMEYKKTGEWDSLTTLNFLTMVDIEYNKNMRFSDFDEAVTFKDLYDIVQNTPIDD